MKSRLPRLLVTCLTTAALLAPAAASATETDNYTFHYDSVRDSLTYLNDEANGLLLEAVVRANGRGQCDKGELYSAVEAKFVGEGIDGKLWGAFERFIDDDSHLDRRNLSQGQSIYKYVDFWESPVIPAVDLGTNIVVNGVMVGSDKFGHFFSEGRHYFDDAYVDGNGLDSALSLGVFSETEIFGWYLTGVYSYGDLSANYNGMIFWTRLLGEYGDVEYPYIECHDGEWLVADTIDWRDYVDASWDEAINCSGFRDGRMDDQVDRRIRQLESENGHNYHCPISAQTCADLIAANSYGRYWDVNFSPKCIAAAHSLGVDPAVPGAGDAVGDHADYTTIINYFGGNCKKVSCVSAGGSWQPALLALMALLRSRRRRPASNTSKP